MSLYNYAGKVILCVDEVDHNEVIFYFTDGTQCSVTQGEGVVLQPIEFSQNVPTPCKCGRKASEDTHPCPYQQEIYEDNESCCNCCSECEYQCSMDI